MIQGDNFIAIPRITTAERVALPAYNGLLVYDTDLNALYKFENGAWSGFSGGGGGAVSSVFGRTGAVVAQSGDYSKSDVGLSNVDNTSDANKPISTATQTALDLKEDKVIRVTPTADQTTTSATAVDINGLVATLEANSSYLIYGVLRARCSGVGGVRFAMTLVSGGASTISVQGKGAASGSIIPLEEYYLTQTGALIATGLIRVAGGASDIYFNGNITTGATVGTIQLRFASATGGQTSTIDKLGSYIKIEKLP
jgi:hypothetical protein